MNIHLVKADFVMLSFFHLGYYGYLWLVSRRVNFHLHPAVEMHGVVKSSPASISSIIYLKTYLGLIEHKNRS